MSDPIFSRKRSHLHICAHKEVGFRHKTTLLEEVELVHQALPELNLEDIDTSTRFLGRSLAAPILIGAMTGGTGGDDRFNHRLAKAAAQTGLGLCLGSIRPLLVNPALIDEFNVRPTLGDHPLLANIGGTQIGLFGVDAIIENCEKIDADGLTVHLNFGMELVQPEGDRRFAGITDQIGQLVTRSPIPVVVKQTGMGLSKIDGKRLHKTGISWVESAGAGGTSWTAVEANRSDGINKKMGELLWDFGIPTACTTIWMVQAGFNVIASGGLKNGLDIARAMALGATLTAVARPVLLAEKAGGDDGMVAYLEELKTGLSYVMLCCGAATPDALKQTARVIGPNLSRYLDAL